DDQPETLVCAIGQLAKLEWNHDVLRDQGRAQSRAETNEEHTAPVVAADRLHGCVVDDPDRFTESGREVEPGPAGAKVQRLRVRTVTPHQSRVADRDRVVLPVLGGALYRSDHARRRHSLARADFQRLVVPAGKDLNGSAADVDGQNVAGRYRTI